MENWKGIVLGACIIIPITHRIYANGQKRFETDADTVKNAIMDLYAACPAMEGRILDKTGRLLDGMEIAVNTENIFPWKPDTQLGDGDQVRISFIITGG